MLNNLADGAGFAIYEVDISNPVQTVILKQTLFDIVANEINIEPDHIKTLICYRHLTDAFGRPMLEMLSIIHAQPTSPLFNLWEELEIPVRYAFKYEKLYITIKPTIGPVVYAPWGTEPPKFSYSH